MALEKTYETVPEPKIVIAVGSSPISGGLFAHHSKINHGLDNIIPVDLYIPGCPPHPLTILDGLLRLIGKINKNLYCSRVKVQTDVSPIIQYSPLVNRIKSRT